MYRKIASSFANCLIQLQTIPNLNVNNAISVAEGGGTGWLCPGKYGYKVTLPTCRRPSVWRTRLAKSCTPPGLAIMNSNENKKASSQLTIDWDMTWYTKRMQSQWKLVSSPISTATDVLHLKRKSTRFLTSSIRTWSGIKKHQMPLSWLASEVRDQPSLLRQTYLSIPDNLPVSRPKESTGMQL